MVFEKYSNCKEQISLNIACNRIESIRKKHILRTGMRAYKDGIIGIAGEVGSYEEDKLKQKAYAALVSKLPYPCEPSQNRFEHIKVECTYMDDKRFISEMEATVEAVSRMCPDFYFSGKIEKIMQKTELKNDVNLDLIYENNYIKSQILIKHKHSKNIFDAIIKYEKRNHEKTKYIKHIAQICDAYKNNLDILPFGRYPIIFDKSNELPFSKLFLELNGIKYAKKTSLFSNAQDKRIFSSNFSLYQSLNPDDSMSPFFDAEGVVNTEYKYPLIDAGVLLTPYTDKRTSFLYKLPLTGSASGEYDGIPVLKAKTFKVKEVFDTLKELLRGKKGIYPILADGSSFDSEGNFNMPIQLALIFDGENFLGRLPELQINSNIFEMLGSGFVGASKDGYTVMELNIK